MKRRFTIAVAVAAALAVVAGCSSDKSESSGQTGSGSGSGLSTDGQGKTLTVWLQSDAQKGWPDVVNSATQRFEAATGAKVKVEWQNWSNYTTKLDSTFAGSTGVPDVVELGNTQTSSYIAGGAFADLSGVKGQFDNSGTWLQGLAESASAPDGKLYGVPYYAGSRVVIYRKDVFAKAGVTTAPTTLDEMFADLDKVKAANSADKNFSSFYMPGKYWYAGMSFVYGAGGKIAQPDGKTWKGTLASPEAQKGLEQWKRLASDYSVGGTTKTEADQDAIMAQGHTGAILGNGWELGVVTDKKSGNPKLAPNLATFPLPGAAAGEPTPSFLGGSDLAVPKKAPNGLLGATWIKYFTDTASQTALAKFAIPNTTSLLDVYGQVSEANKATGEAAKKTWFVPNTPNWANVESGNILQNTLGAIASGKQSAAEAGAAADTEIAKVLNAGG